jgi:RNA polymerase sigma factor (sigma-70 family)
VKSRIVGAASPCFQTKVPWFLRLKTVAGWRLAVEPNRFMETPDAQLVEACRRGDQAAWETLVRRYQRLVYSIPRRAGLDEQNAADVFQRVFASLFEQLDSLAQPDRVSAWLVTVSRRETVRMVRQVAVARGQLEGEAAAANVADTDPIAEEMLQRLEEQRALRQAVENLAPRCQDLVKLLFFGPDPLPYADVARRLGMAEGSIGPIRGRCLEQLKRNLQVTAPGVFSLPPAALFGERR